MKHIMTAGGDFKHVIAVSRTDWQATVQLVNTCDW